MLSFVNAQTANRRRDQIEVYKPRLNDNEESKKITAGVRADRGHRFRARRDGDIRGSFHHAGGRQEP